MRTFAKIAAIVLALALLAAFAVGYWTMSLGHDALRDIATQANLCKTGDCPEGIDEASAFLGEEFGLSPRLVQWCVGVDTLAETPRGERTTGRTWWVELLYKPCGAPLTE
ncbi:hypothetical protein [Aminobacter sp. HY435]|uniref:hypothetical protein n=1 Tax=Aminobacter sp. HY435 TaxID=2970917 RepID=UPI0022B98978|nr:hypothetical protein [Aminobacter sp. HY435]